MDFNLLIMALISFLCFCLLSVFMYNILFHYQLQILVILEHVSIRFKTKLNRIKIEYKCL